MTMRRLSRRARSGLTLIELMVGLAIMAVLVVLVGPSFLGMIDMQRLRGTSAQFVTDVQYARSEAISRQQNVGITVGRAEDWSLTCYIITACPLGSGPSACTCNCSEPEGSRCLPYPGLKELRTVQVPADTKIQLRSSPNGDGEEFDFVMFDPMTGGMQPFNIGTGVSIFTGTGAAWYQTSLVRDGTKTLRLMISATGRPSVCSPASAPVSGTKEC